MVKEQMILDMLTDISERMDKMHVMLESLAGQRTFRIQPRQTVTDGQMSIVTETTIPEIATVEDAPKARVGTKYNKDDDSHQVYFRIGDREVYVGTYRDQAMIEQAIRTAEANPEQFILRAEERAAARAKNKEQREERAKQAEIRKMEIEISKKEKEIAKRARELETAKKKLLKTK